MGHHGRVAIVWVTGISGAGKSSVCEALKARGRVAIDADWAGYSHWVDRVTGAVVRRRPHPVPPDWRARFGWQISVERVRALAEETRSGTVFLCGSVENEAAVWHSFDRVVCLVVDDDTLRQRLATRTTNDFGKDPEEREAVVAWNRETEAQYRRRGAAVIDATRPLEVVVRDVEALAATPAGD
jgi:dephospho-CoA kinase